jgi:hypothetical protein
VYGPVRTVVWQGSAGNRCPYADQLRQTEKLTLAQRGQHPPLNDLYANLSFGVWTYQSLPCKDSIVCHLDAKLS